jgi:hypothetical protein
MNIPIKHTLYPILSLGAKRLKTCAFALFSLAVLSISCTADEDHPHEPYPEKEYHQSTPMPDRLVLTWAGDPASTQAITWRTDTSVSQSWVEVMKATDKPLDFQGERVSAKTQAFVSDLGESHYHSVELTDLESNSLYAYRVGDGVNWSEWQHFRTAKAEAAPFSFVYFGDAQNNIRMHWSRVFREAYRAAPDAAFTLHAGDLINRAQRDAEWGEWFGAPGWVNGTTPMIVTPGNHEYYARPLALGADPESKPLRALSDHWRVQFTLPQHGPEGLDESVYYIDYQGVRFISLNSSEKQEAQVSWLRDVLQNNPNRWTLITFHHPIFSPARNRDNPELRRLWKPVFDEFKVDLIMNGHDHTYARSGDVSALGKGGIYNVADGFNQVYDPAIGVGMSDLSDTPPSEPDVQISRIRLSSQRLPPLWRLIASALASSRLKSPRSAKCRFGHR